MNLKPGSVNLFKGKHGNFEIKKTRKGIWIFSTKEFESEIDAKDWRFEDLKSTVIRINEILGVGGEGFVYYDSKLDKAVKIVQKHFGPKRKYKIEHDKWRSGQFSGKLDDLLQELKRYGKGYMFSSFLYHHFGIMISRISSKDLLDKNHTVGSSTVGLSYCIWKDPTSSHLMIQLFYLYI